MIHVLSIAKTIISVQNSFDLLEDFLNPAGSLSPHGDNILHLHN